MTDPRMYHKSNIWDLNSKNFSGERHSPLPCRNPLLAPYPAPRSSPCALILAPLYALDFGTCHLLIHTNYILICKYKHGADDRIILLLLLLCSLGPLQPTWYQLCISLSVQNVVAFVKVVNRYVMSEFLSLITVLNLKLLRFPLVISVGFWFTLWSPAQWAFKCGYVKSVVIVEEILGSYDDRLFRTASYENRCLHYLLPVAKSTKYALRAVGHGLSLGLVLPELHKKTFINRMIFTDCC